MLTPEQTKNLKPGDPILIHGTFDSLTEYGNICYSSKYACWNGEFFTSSCTAHPSLISLPSNGIKNTEASPKYDPCRKFKKGDKVRVVEWNGRNYCDYDHHTELKTGCIAEISDDEEDEQEEGYVSVIYQEYIRYVPPCYLELVTPIEEMEPYSVKFLQAGEVPDTYYYWAVMDDMGHEVARFWHEQYEKGQAEASAKAECARLNAEYRKEQNNG